MFFRKKQSTQSDGLHASVAAANTIRAENNRIIALLAQDYLKEQKSRQVWRGIKFFTLLAVAVIVFWQYQSADEPSPEAHTALVEINGIIGPYAENSDSINYGLRRAFAAKKAKGVILRINSPGGSPVQSAEINREIHRLKNDYPDKPFYVVISDICASGGYYVAVAADQIYGNHASLVGSIGVRFDGFGFVEAMKKLGIERRLLVAGQNKGLLDPFLPQNTSQTKHVKAVLNQIHQQFIAAVKQGRGARLADHTDLFSGLFWSGEQARELGLIDQFGTIDDVARDVIGAETIVEYTFEVPLFERFTDQLSSTIVNTLLGRYFSLQ